MTKTNKKWQDSNPVYTEMQSLYILTLFLYSSLHKFRSYSLYVVHFVIQLLQMF